MTPKIRTHHWLFKLPFMSGFAGITLWPYILFRGFPYSEETSLFRHEVCHFRQQERLWVIGFYVAYITEFIYKYLKKRDWMEAYMDISFEREAREAE